MCQRPPKSLHQAPDSATARLSPCTGFSKPDFKSRLNRSSVLHFLTHCLLPPSLRQGPLIRARTCCCSTTASPSAPCSLPRSATAKDPFSGHLFVFRGKNASLLKILSWDGMGLCLFTKRIDPGKFFWPRLAEPGSSVTLSPAQLAMLLEGMASPCRPPRQPPSSPGQTDHGRQSFDGSKLRQRHRFCPLSDIVVRRASESSARRSLTDASIDRRRTVKLRLQPVQSTSGTDDNRTHWWCRSRENLRV